MLKLLVEPSQKETIYNSDGIILPLKDFSVESTCFYTLEEIKEISKSYQGEIFIKMNKNLMNEDVPKVEELLIELDKLNISGIFFYDLAILQLKKELNLKVDLVWNQTHMVNNYKTCDYYFSKGVKYALLGKEITLDEIKEIIKESKITSMVEVVSIPSVAFSKRKLLSNYYKALEKDIKKNLLIEEKQTKDKYQVIEDDNGTCFYLDKVTNGTSIIKDLFEVDCKYIIFREYNVPSFKELVSDTLKYIKNNCNDDEYINKYKRLGDSTNFFFKKTIYKVK